MSNAHLETAIEAAWDARDTITSPRRAKPATRSRRRWTRWIVASCASLKSRRTATGM